MRTCARAEDEKLMHIMRTYARAEDEMSKSCSLGYHQVVCTVKMYS